jgi:hypothetical protein
VRPRLKLSTVRWWESGDATLGTGLSVADASTNEVYAAMDWLAGRRGEIEKKLAAYHLRPGSIAMFDLSSSWVEGSHCELAAFRVPPRRQARPAADRVWAAHRSGGPPGRGRGVWRQRPGGTLDVVAACKNLKHFERDFRIAKADDLDLRPIHHYLAGRVRGHVLICMVACYLTWHLRQALAELTFTDQHIPAPADPVAPAQRSAQAKDAAKHTPSGLPVRKHRDLLGHLSTLDRQTITFADQTTEKLTSPTPVQRRAFEQLGAPHPYCK